MNLSRSDANPFGDAGRCERLRTRGRDAVSKATFAPAHAVNDLLAGEGNGPRRRLDPVTRIWCPVARKKSPAFARAGRELRLGQPFGLAVSFLRGRELVASVGEAVEVSVPTRGDEILLRAALGAM